MTKPDLIIPDAVTLTAEEVAYIRRRCYLLQRVASGFGSTPAYNHARLISQTISKAERREIRRIKKSL